MNLSEIYKSILLEDNSGASDTQFKTWKLKNVTLRGIKSAGGERNHSYGSFGKGLYTVPLSNISMAKQYGDIYFVVNARPKKPKIANTLNDAELVRQGLIDTFCKNNNVEYSRTYFETNTTMESEMLKLGYDGLIIKGREMVNYTPTDVKIFKTASELYTYFETEVI